jgi:hypothetical protein
MDLGSPYSRDNLITYMFHKGVLTYTKNLSFGRQQFRVPNEIAWEEVLKEIRRIWQISEEAYLTNMVTVDILRQTGCVVPFLDRLQSFFSPISRIRYYLLKYYFQLRDLNNAFYNILKMAKKETDILEHIVRCGKSEVFPDMHYKLDMGNSLFFFEVKHFKPQHIHLPRKKTGNLDLQELDKRSMKLIKIENEKLLELPCSWETKLS